jgi:hypothetical protein
MCAVVARLLNDGGLGQQHMLRHGTFVVAYMATRGSVFSVSNVVSDAGKILSYEGYITVGCRSEYYDVTYSLGMLSYNQVFVKMQCQRSFHPYQPPPQMSVVRRHEANNSYVGSTNCTGDRASRCQLQSSGP